MAVYEKLKGVKISLKYLSDEPRKMESEKWEKETTSHGNQNAKHVTPLLPLEYFWELSDFTRGWNLLEIILQLTLENDKKF